jgi:CheY-like chemotaxis protein
MNNYETVNLLMVDDDSVDVKMFERSLKQHRITNPLHVACDGEEAMEMLKNNQIPKPLIIILDLNMPRMNGIEFLQELRCNSGYQETVVFVMTTSNAEADKVEAYNFNVAGYMVKSELGDNFLHAIDLIDRYWKTIQLPV